MADITLTFDAAQEAFRATPSTFTAGVYMARAMEYEADDMIGDDTFLDALAEVRDWLQKPDPRDVFIGMIARLSASGDKVDLDGEEWPNGYEHDTGGSLDALDELIHKAREMTGIAPPEPEAEAADAL